MPLERPGVIRAIIKALEEATPYIGITLDGILTKLCEQFPERRPEAMRVTIGDTVRRQLPDRGYKIEKRTHGTTSKKMYWMDAGQSPQRPYSTREEAADESPLRYTTHPISDTDEIDVVPKGISSGEAVGALTRLRNDLTAAEGRIITLEGRLEEAYEDVNKAKEHAMRAEQLAQSGVKRLIIKVTDQQGLRVLEEKQHPRLEYILKLVNTRPDPTNINRRMNVMLIGPAGAGKTFVSEQVAKCMGLKFSFNTCTGGMSEGHLLGKSLPGERTPREMVKYYNRLIRAGLPPEAAAMACSQSGAFRYIRSEFVRAFEEGGVHLLDEMDAADQNTILILQTAIEGRRLHIPNRPEKPYAIRHEDFICIAACNTFGNGADRMYVGRNQQDMAWLNRWQMGQVEMDYDPALEMYLCPDDKLRNRLQAFRSNCTKKMVRRIISSRALRDAYAMKMNGISDGEIDHALFGGWNDDEKTKAKDGVKIDGEEDDDKNIDQIPGGIMPEDASPKPTCPDHGNVMVRMGSNRGWRCGVSGNKYKGDGKWSVCSHTVFDKKGVR